MRNLNFWLLFPFLEPLLFKDYLIGIDHIFTILKLLAFFILLKEYVKKRMMSMLFFFVVIYQAWLFIATFISDNGNIFRFFGPAVSTVGVIMYVELAVKKGKFLQCLQYLVQILVTFCIINFFTVILLPNGFNYHGGDNYLFFLGLENRFAFYFLPLVAFASIYSYMKYGKVKKNIYLISIFNMMVLIFKWAVGGMLGLIMINLLIIFRKHFLPYRLFNSLTCFFVVLLSNFLLVFLRVQEYFEDFIVNDLGKDITLTGRTELWDYGFYSFAKHPLWGIGYLDLNNLPPDMLNVGHMHNLFMNVLFYGGLGGLFFFIIIQLIWVKRLYRYRKTFEASVLNLTLFTSLMMSLGDTFDSATYWLLVVMCCSLGKIKNNEYYGYGKTFNNYSNL